MTVFKIKQVGETIRTIYQELFILRFVHSGYETPRERFLSKGLLAEPDARSSALFKNYRIDYRFDESDLVCYVECDLLNPPALEPKIPFVKVPANLVIRFLLYSSSDFASKTHVVAAGSEKTYLFNNHISNVGGFTFLTRPVQPYVSTGDYEIGTIVEDTGDLYSPRKSVLGADGISITNTLFWQKLRPTEEVVNNADLFDNAIVKPSTVCFGVVDIHKNGTVNNNYKVFDAGDELFKPAPVFTIKFDSVI